MLWRCVEVSKQRYGMRVVINVIESTNNQLPSFPSTSIPFDGAYELKLLHASVYSLACLWLAAFSISLRARLRILPAALRGISSTNTKLLSHCIALYDSEQIRKVAPAINDLQFCMCGS